MAATLSSRARSVPGLVMDLIGLALAAASVVIAWLTVTFTFFGGSSSFYLFVYGSVCTSMTGGNCSPATSPPLALMGAEFALFAGIALAVIGMVLTLVRPGVAAAVSGLAFALVLAAPITWLVYYQYNGVSMFTSPYSPGYGWYLAIVGAILLLIGTILSARDRKKGTTSTPMMGAPSG